MTMYKIYDIVKHKTNIRGYWLDNNKLYKDNIDIKEVKSIKDIKRIKYLLFIVKKQLAIFYIKFNKAYIESKNGDIDVLKECIQYKVNKISKDYIKRLLKEYNGITIIKNNNDYIIEIWR